MEVLETIEPVNCDMMMLFDRAFNPELCKDIIATAEENVKTVIPIFVNGVMHEVKGTSISCAQVLRKFKRDWCSGNYRVMYRSDLNRDEEMKELRIGVTIRVTPNMAFSVLRDDADLWAEREAERRLMRRL